MLLYLWGCMISQDEAVKQYQQVYQEKADEWKANKPTVLLVGRTGVGKSSIINAVFGQDIAKVGAGQPITQHYSFYEGEFINLYDTRGWELGATEEEKFRRDTQKFLTDPPTDSKHTTVDIIWYVLDAPGARFTDFDAELALTAFGNMKILFVLSKADIAHPDQVQALRQAIEETDIPNNIGIVEIAANPQALRGRPAAEKSGLEAIVDATIKALPDAKKPVFAAAQNVNLQQKDIASKTVIRNYTLAAFGVGFTPVPFADAAVLFPLQLGLVVQLAVIYEIDVDIAKAASSFMAEQVVTSLGRSAAGRLLKMVPGAGMILGGTITGTVAASFTAAIGFTFRTVFHEMYKAKASGRVINEALFTELLNDTFKRVWADLAKNTNISRYDNLK